jgi:hypothetical protein
MPTLLVGGKEYTLHIPTFGGGMGYTCASILLVVEIYTPCTPILLAVERGTPSVPILLVVEIYTPCMSTCCW